MVQSAEPAPASEILIRTDSGKVFKMELLTQNLDMMFWCVKFRSDVEAFEVLCCLLVRSYSLLLKSLHG